jgi:hypothetical protein
MRLKGTLWQGCYMGAIERKGFVQFLSEPRSLYPWRPEPAPGIFDLLQ